MDEKDKILMDNALKHFEIHASQRIQVLNFCIVIESLFVTGLLAILSSNLNRLIGLFASLSISFFSVCFYLMDYRMRQMIKSSEHVLQKIEQSLNIENEKCVFNFTEYNMKTLSQTAKKHPSWSRILKLIYGFFFFSGLIGFIVFLVLYICNL